MGKKVKNNGAAEGHKLLVETEMIVLEVKRFSRKDCCAAEFASRGWFTLSYDEKPGFEAMAPKRPDRPPLPRQHASPTQDHEYERLGTVSLPAGLDLHRGRLPRLSARRIKARTLLSS